MAESGLDPIAESATAPSLGSGILLRPTSSIPGVVARGPRLDPIAESATAPSLARGPRLDPIAESVTIASGPSR
jgi:hypothetical protein